MVSGRSSVDAFIVIFQCINIVRTLPNSNIHGAQVALELMSAPDNDGHTPLEWAADAGDVNVMEFFIRKGLSPYRRDATNRTALFWAVKVSIIAGIALQADIHSITHSLTHYNYCTFRAGACQQRGFW